MYPILFLLLYGDSPLISIKFMFRVIAMILYDIRSIVSLPHVSFTITNILFSMQLLNRPNITLILT